jgi:transforming growth factor-beta-induced protein
MCTIPLQLREINRINKKIKKGVQVKKYTIPSIIVLVSLVLAACAGAAPTPEPTEPPVEEVTEEPVEETPPTIVDIAVADGNFSTLVTALQAAGLVETLQGDGPFTVFAPTDEAFAALPEGTVESLLEDPEALKNILLYHVVGAEVLAADAIGLNGQDVETMSGKMFKVTVDGENVMINDAKVVATDIVGSNGVIHVIDSVILPPIEGEEMMEESRSIVDIAVEDGRFTTLVTALQEAELVEALQAEGPFTVFAPTDDAFAALPEGTVEGLLADKEALTNVLLYHVVDGKVMAADVIDLDGQEVETLSGDKIMVALDGENVLINESKVIIPDIEASNGVIHVIDSVLLPPADEAMEENKTIVEIAVEDGRFTTLVTALQEAELVEALQSEGPFTVFAPTDDAFAALPEGALDELIADKEALTNLLLYHVLEGKVMSTQAIELAGQQVEMLSGENILISLDGEILKVNDSAVIIPDIEASNGVIHVIDAVLLP